MGSVTSPVANLLIHRDATQPRQLKDRYDRANVFRMNANIVPSQGNAR